MARLEFFGLWFKTGTSYGGNNCIITAQTINELFDKRKYVGYSSHIQRNNVTELEIEMIDNKLMLKLRFCGSYPDYEKEDFVYELPTSWYEKSIMTPKPTEHFSVLFADDELIYELMLQDFYKSLELLTHNRKSFIESCDVI